MLTISVTVSLIVSKTGQNDLVTWTKTWPIYFSNVYHFATFARVHTSEVVMELTRVTKSDYSK